ncbi:MAG: hypothetical protein QOJ19_3315 [Acidimicrobiia bacterium]|jgi:hypothetical protein|nr:hypothetical protein [Acidimicrobiia bacterium]
MRIAGGHAKQEDNPLPGMTPGRDVGGISEGADHRADGGARRRGADDDGHRGSEKGLILVEDISRVSL